MPDYEIAAPTRLCAATGRELNAGERYLRRLDRRRREARPQDFAADAWPGPPAGAIAHWAGRVPAGDRPRKPTFNDEQLLGLFHHLAGADRPDPGELALRRRAAADAAEAAEVRGREADAEGGDVLVLRDAKSGARHEVPDPRLTEDEIAAVQDEVFRQLGWE